MLGPTLCPPGLGLFYLLLRLILLLHIKMCTWWALRSPGCIRKRSLGGHLNKESVRSTPSAEAQLSVLFLFFIFFLGREQNMVQLSVFFPQANRRVSLLQLYMWQHDVSSKISSSHGSERWSQIVGFCHRRAVTIWAVFPTRLPAKQVSTPISVLRQDAQRQIITVLVGQLIAQSSCCCSRLCLWQLDSTLTGRRGSATLLTDFVKCAAYQNTRTAPAEVSHPLLTITLLALPVTCGLRNERHGDAFIYITNAKVRRTWIPLISQRFISLSDQMGMHNTSDGQ